MRGEAEHMLHLQVSHLKIPIHYIVYGKVTPFTDHYATLLCPGTIDDIIWMCFARGLSLKSAGRRGVFHR